MAITKNNVFTQGMSGLIGDMMMFRSFNGNTYVYNKARKPTKESALQRDNRSKFRRATAFAKTMMADPQKKELYRKIAKKLKLPNAYTAAITEYMRSGKIEQVNTSKYKGKAGDQITIRVSKKDFEMKTVEVVIKDREGNILEQGSAEKAYKDGWSYKVRNTVYVKELLQIRVMAWDHAGRLSEAAVDLLPAM